MPQSFARTLPKFWKLNFDHKAKQNILFQKWIYEIVLKLKKKIFHESSRWFANDVGIGSPIRPLCEKWSKKILKKLIIFELSFWEAISTSVDCDDNLFSYKSRNFGKKLTNSTYTRVIKNIVWKNTNLHNQHFTDLSLEILRIKH